MSNSFTGKTPRWLNALTSMMNHYVTTGIWMMQLLEKQVSNQICDYQHAGKVRKQPCRMWNSIKQPLWRSQPESMFAGNIKREVVEQHAKQTLWLNFVWIHRWCKYGMTSWTVTQMSIADALTISLQTTSCNIGKWETTPWQLAKLNTCVACRSAGCCCSLCSR